MAQQNAEDNDKKTQQGKLESDNYLIGFLDSLFAGIIAFSFTIMYSTLVKQNMLITVNIEKHVILFLMAFVFIVADWTGSRALVKDYPYVSKNVFARTRVLIDVLIGCLYFALIIFASVLSYLYVITFAIIFMLGAIWTCVLRLEYNQFNGYVAQIKQDPRLKFIMATHLLLAVIFFFIYIMAPKGFEQSLANVNVFIGVVATFSSIFTLYKVLCWIRFG